MTRSTRPPADDRGLFLVATDVGGRVSLLAGPYPTVHAAALRVRATAGLLATMPDLAGFGHLTVAEGPAAAATVFGRLPAPGPQAPGDSPVGSPWTPL